jgi:hypothetical protein
MAVLPKAKLYASDGATLLYTFELVQDTNLFDDPGVKSIVHESPRGKGCVIVNGGTPSWDLYIRGLIVADDFEALVVKIEAMKSAIAVNTAYYLKFDKTVSTTYSHRVKRIRPISITQEGRDKLYHIANYEVVFTVNSW